MVWSLPNLIVISVTIGGLQDELLSLESYGEFLRGHDAVTGQIEPEPRADIETVLTLRLEVGPDLDPSCLLYSERAQEQGLERGITWKHRAALAPARIGNYASTHLSWNRSSVLNRLTDERPDLGAELVRAARDEGGVRQPGRRSIGGDAADRDAHRHDVGCARGCISGTLRMTKQGMKKGTRV